MSEKLKSNPDTLPEDTLDGSSEDQLSWNDLTEKEFFDDEPSDNELVDEFTAQTSTDYLDDVEDVDQDANASPAAESPTGDTSDDLDITIDELFHEPDPDAADELLAAARLSSNANRNAHPATNSGSNFDAQAISLNNLNQPEISDQYPTSLDYDLANLHTPEDREDSENSETIEDLHIPERPAHVLHIPITEITEAADGSAESAESATPSAVSSFMNKYDDHPTARELAQNWDELISSVEPGPLSQNFPEASEFHLSPEKTLETSIARAYQPTPTEMIEQFSSHIKQLAAAEANKPASKRDPELLARLENETEALKVAALSLENNPNFTAKTALDDVVGRFATSQHASDLDIARAAANLSESYDRRAKPAAYTLGQQLIADARHLRNSAQGSHSKPKHPSRKRTLDPTLI